MSCLWHFRYLKNRISEAEYGSFNSIYEKACVNCLMQPKRNIDVLIVGAGAAGLAAWRKLRSAGCQAVILEARDRIGGRILTDYFRSSPVELGAEFIHGKPKTLWPLLKKAHLEVLESSGTRMVFDKGVLHPCPAYWENIQTVNERIDPAGEVSYDRFLETVDASESAKAFAKSYVEGFNAARAELIGTSAIAMADRTAAKIEGQRQFRLRMGYWSLIDWLAKGLPRESLHLETTVREIHWQQHQVQALADTPEGERTFSATRLIVTVPLGVLRATSDLSGAIRFLPPMPQKEMALERLEVGHVVKLMICFKERFWEVDSRFGFAVSLAEDFPTWWTQEPLTSNILTGWAGGPAGEKLVNLSQAEIYDRAIKSLSRIFAKSIGWLDECAEKIYFHNWSDDPFSRGAYSYPKTGGLKAARILALPVDSTIFFAGEATDSRGANGTVHAALKSGIKAARTIAGASGKSWHLT